MDVKILEKTIYDLEYLLIQPKIRQSPEKIAELLSDEFFEFCSSGSIYFYKKDDVFDEKKDPSTVHWEIKDFKIKLLSTDVVLATYRAIKHDESTQEIKYSLRSSIWKCFNGQWKIVFHQGTITNQVRASR